MSKRDWPRCNEPDCATAVREIAGDYRGPRQPEADGKCARHKVVDTEFVPTPAPAPTPDEEETEPEATLDESPVASERIASLRDALREGVVTTEVAELVREQLLQGLRASKSHFVTCPSGSAIRRSLTQCVEPSGEQNHGRARIPAIPSAVLDLATSSVATASASCRGRCSIHRACH
jgi:hypothetical protein